MKKLLLLLLALIISVSIFSQEVKYNPNQIWVTDLDDVFTDVEEAQLQDMLEAYHLKTTIQIGVLTTSDYEDFGEIGNYAIAVAEKWGLGQKDIDNGLLLVISKINDDEFCATGYGLEGYLTDAHISRFKRESFVDSLLYYPATVQFLNLCMTQIGDEYSADENETKREENSGLWAWFLAIPWYWKALAVGLYILLWIVSPETAIYLTFFMFSSSDNDSGSSMGGGKFGGGGN